MNIIVIWKLRTATFKRRLTRTKGRNMQESTRRETRTESRHKLESTNHETRTRLESMHRPVKRS